MNDLKKLIRLKFILIIFYLIIVAPASAEEFTFRWDSLIINNEGNAENQSTKFLIKKLSSAEFKISTPVNSKDTFFLYPDKNYDSTEKIEKKSAIDNIKITFSPASTFMTPRHETYTSSDDEQIAKITQSITSLIYDNAKIKSLEEIGKITEPQIHFYFEF